MTAAKAYRLLKAIFNTAVDDGLIRRNPCRIKGAGQEKSPERPVLSIPQVYTLADAVPERYRALVLLTVFRQPARAPDRGHSCGDHSGPCLAHRDLRRIR